MTRFIARVRRLKSQRYHNIGGIFSSMAAAIVAMSTEMAEEPRWKRGEVIVYTDSDTPAQVITMVRR